MGEYLSNGICTRVFVEKKRVDLNKISIQDIENGLKKEIDISMYEFGESEKFLVWNLKKEYLEAGKVINILKEFLEDYGENKEEKERHEGIYKRIEKIESYEDMIKFAEKKPYQEFQMMQYRNYVRLEKLFNEGEYFYFDCIIFSLDGKIIMECYRDLLLFWEKVLRDRYKKHELAGALKVVIG